MSEKKAQSLPHALDHWAKTLNAYHRQLTPDQALDIVSRALVFLIGQNSEQFWGQVQQFAQQAVTTKEQHPYLAKEQKKGQRVQVVHDLDPADLVDTLGALEDGFDQIGGSTTLQYVAQAISNQDIEEAAAMLSRIRFDDWAIFPGIVSAQGKPFYLSEVVMRALSDIVEGPEEEEIEEGTPGGEEWRTSQKSRQQDITKFKKTWS